MRAAFLADTLRELSWGHDTTVALMKECIHRGHEVWIFEQHQLGWVDGKVYASARRLAFSKHRDSFEITTTQELSLRTCDVVFLRKDPPVDVAFLHATQIISLVEPRPLFINEPAGLQFANEKLFGLSTSVLMPRTLVSANSRQLADFVASVKEGVVIKPLDGFAGRQVFFLKPGDLNTRSLLETMTHNERTCVMAQAYLPQAQEGDKRILLLDGEPLGAVLRVPQTDDFRCNLAKGGTATACELTNDEIQMVKQLKPLLKRHGLAFVGIDVIGGYLTEINVTSPTGIVEAERLSGERLCERVIEWVEKEVSLRGAREYQDNR